jgi:hypothetical protein
VSTPGGNAKSPYDRPNQPWTCGLACAGRACSAGPSSRGDCPAAPECAPLREGDRWVCNRSALRGGPCEMGPSPEGACGCAPHCVPVRNLRTRRGRFVVACTIATAATLLVTLNTDWRNDLITPGPITTQHAQLLRRAGVPPNCAACHAAASEGPFAWTSSLLLGHDGEPTQSELCLKCHAASIPPKFASDAHSVPAESLAQLRHVDTSIHKVALSPVPPLSRSLGCATCHKEHQGAAHELTAMNDRACQTCHQQTYHSFASDHPDFDGWPYKQRTPIAFDHGSHQAKHFIEKKQAFECRACHMEDSGGEVQLLATYEAACAACHDEKIATSARSGVPMLALPTLDVTALRAAGHDIGSWPAAATGDFDGRLPPAMKLLLAADPAAARALAILGPEFEFFDVDAKNREHLAACADLAQAIKRLVAELSESGALCVQRRLSSLTGGDLSTNDVNALCSGLSGDTLRLVADAWLGRAANANGSRPISISSAAGSWYYDAASLSMRYQPAGHADSILTAWLDYTASAAGKDMTPVALAMLKELSRPTTPGLCVSCHNIRKQTSDELTVQWQPANRTSGPRGFTKFSHGPHVLLPELSNCSACHAIDQQDNSAASMASWDERSLATDFQPMNKQACATCHTSKGAGDSCQMCHNYHVTLEGLELRVKGKVLHPQLSTLNSQPTKTSSDTPPARR